MLQTGYTEDNTGINPYAKAVYDFSGQYPNELSFRRDEIIHLLKHVDSHWTLGMIGTERGIFPTSYVDIIVDCVDGPVESFLLRPSSATEVPIMEGWAVAEHSYVAQEKGDVSVVQGETLKVVEIIDENWAIVETQSLQSGMCPRNHFRMLSAEQICNIEEQRDNFNDKSDPLSLPGDTLSNSNLPRSGDLEVNSSLNFDDIGVGDMHLNFRKSETNGNNVNLVSIDALKAKRVYSKDDFGPIKSKALDDELNKNISSLDHSFPLRPSRVNRTVFTSSTSSEKAESPSLRNFGSSSTPSPPLSDVASMTEGNKPSRPPLPSRASLKMRNKSATVDHQTPSCTAKQAPACDSSGAPQHAANVDSAEFPRDVTHRAAARE
ncbi:hypothetical protein HAZT_HAZT001811 [Hyalella azteca]|uniref:SH3 domain-containing protein n=1 Tax=Hyalella azteca TaxID=294128 RepID=A0A6A0H8K5_HYAAZ|nr:hypothetical protein HAZT_HAZT001811 [Hyalella azteca]